MRRQTAWHVILCVSRELHAVFVPNSYPYFKSLNFFNSSGYKTGSTYQKPSLFIRRNEGSHFLKLCVKFSLCISKSGRMEKFKNACIQICLCSLYRGHTKYRAVENEGKLHSKGSCQVTFRKYLLLLKILPSCFLGKRK